MQVTQINRSVRSSADAHDLYECFVSQSFCNLSFRIERNPQFAISSKVHALDGFMVSRFTTDAGKGDLIRSKSSISQDGHGRFALYMPLKGELELEQLSRTAKCEPGSLLLASMAEPFVQRKSGNNDTIYFFMPHDFVDQHLIGAENFCARTFPVTGGIWQLINDTVKSFQQDADYMVDTEFRSAARTIGELVFAAMGSASDRYSEARSVRLRNLARAKRIVREFLPDSSFTISDLAAECGISLRYLHELFRLEGVTVSDYIKQQRLQRAHYLLSNASGSTSVTDVCFRCGFSNMSQFSTAFRRAFSVCPREVLRGAR